MIDPSKLWHSRYRNSNSLPSKCLIPLFPDTWMSLRPLPLFSNISLWYFPSFHLKTVLWKHFSQPYIHIFSYALKPSLSHLYSVYRNKAPAVGPWGDGDGMHLGSKQLSLSNSHAKFLPMGNHWRTERGASAMVTPLLSLKSLADRSAQSTPVKTFPCCIQNKEEKKGDLAESVLEHIQPQWKSVILIPVSCFLTEKLNLWAWQKKRCLYGGENMHCIHKMLHESSHALFPHTK